ncbi:MAG: DUF3102 domain-containing protein [Planctomycetaceae bacterium]|nr:DUF3102 domain-containing protein [Planctomycetales bacterium]MCB9926074.1 DUF3102 domain-containing protein [Planctomycetaceae bacterium]
MTASIHNRPDDPATKIRLPELAAKIAENHELAVGAMRSSLEYARAAGSLLIEAKKQVRFGEWSEWLSSNTPISNRTAQAYQRIARHWPKIAANAQSSADLSIEGALSLIANPKPATSGDSLPLAPSWCIPAPGNCLLAVHVATDVLFRIDPHDDDNLYYLTVASAHELSYSSRPVTEYGVQVCLPIYLRDFFDGQTLSRFLSGEPASKSEFTITEAVGVRGSGYHWLVPDSDLDWSQEPGKLHRCNPTSHSG